MIFCLFVICHLEKLTAVWPVNEYFLSALWASLDSPAGVEYVSVKYEVIFMKISEMELRSNHKDWDRERMFTFTLIYNFFRRHLESNPNDRIKF